MIPVEVGLDHVVFGFGGAPLHFDVSFPAGTTTAVLGPSGSGKSTLLNLIAGFERPDSGLVRIGGIDMTDRPPADRPISMVFQENNLFSHLDVAKNVGLGRSPSLRLDGRDRDAIAGALARTGLSGMEKRLPRELSGGERQRVALARVLVRERPVLLMDEPFAALDAALRESMLVMFQEIRAERPITIVMVTHQPDDARGIADFILTLEAGAISNHVRTDAWGEGTVSRQPRSVTP